MGKLISFLAVPVILLSCSNNSNSNDGSSLDKLLIQSWKQNKFKVLENNLAINFAFLKVGDKLLLGEIIEEVKK